MVSVSCFGAKVSVMFHFIFVHYTLSSVWVAEWPTFGLPTWLAICSHCILSIFNIYLFPVLVFRAGFAFWLLQFLFIAFLLLLNRNRFCASHLNRQLFATKDAFKNIKSKLLFYSKCDRWAAS